MNKPINIGVVGLGRLGRLYAKYFTNRLPGARLYGVTDLMPDAVKATVAETGAKGYASYQELLADPAVDAVVVMTPTKTHGEVVIAAAAAKKAIFCEKPLSLEVTEGEAMKAAVAKHGVFFQLGFMRRFDRAYAAAKKRIDAGDIGTPVI